MQVIANVIDDTHTREGMLNAFPSVYNANITLEENAKNILEYLNGWAVVCNGIIMVKPYEQNVITPV